MALSPRATTWIVVIVGLFIAVSGLISYIIFPHVLRWQIKKNLVLSPHSEVYQHWKEVPVPIYVEFYFFNVTNPEDILDGLSKPILEEVGPYTFRETRHKTNITWNYNGTVSYIQIKRWFFEPDLTVGSLDDVITTVNVPLASTVAFGNTVEDDYFRNAVAQIILGTASKLFIEKHVSELLFDGYEDPLITIANQMGMNTPYDKFGWFYMKNNSDDGIYTIFTGSKGMENYGFVDSWNKVNELEVWEGPCNTIKGTAGDMWPPFRTRNEKLALFAPEACRSFQLSYLKDASVYGIDVYNFVLDETTFDNGKVNSDNQCYCTDSCLPPGALNLSACQYNAPILMSFPHFLYAHLSYRQQVVGMKPDPEKHKFFIDLEPDMSVPLKVAARLQLNVAVQKFDLIPELQRIQPVTYYPTLWISESATVDISMAKKLKFVKNELPNYVTIGSFLLVVIGGCVLTSGLLYVVWKTKNQKKRACHHQSRPLLHVFAFTSRPPTSGNTADSLLA